MPGRAPRMAVGATIATPSDCRATASRVFRPSRRTSALRSKPPSTADLTAAAGGHEPPHRPPPCPPIRGAGHRRPSARRGNSLRASTQPGQLPFRARTERHRAFHCVCFVISCRCSS
ncbi:proline-rich receptor-like protein kinase PERK2 [Iris pallida]|uniref:Proline-rich receptor-like protein kinase PERK2 n=1 Tax=Iris pallida TaxID=29817 RepID=A0AAX6GQ91_IRIPA|nr:proline-rich receptor-like protein kinase PERK2 [Iris pallida]